MIHSKPNSNFDNEIEEFIQVLELSNKIQDEHIRLLIRDFKLTNNLLNVFNNCYNRWEKRLPYHLNLIDELHANENAHSRILVKLLSYECDSRFLIFQSFINYIIEHDQDFRFLHKIKHPKITPEKHRIDALIQDDDYAIIIENKIHGARDGLEQISNYRKKLNDRNINDENIYIIYLSRWGSSPSKESFPEELKEKFKTRYVEISYRYDILDWLNAEILPSYNCNPDEEYLISALQQYIDHLNGLFHLRKIDKKMNDELIKAIENQLGLNKEDYPNNIKILIKQITSLERTKEYLDQLLKINWFKNWSSKLHVDYTGYNIIDEFDNITNYPKTGILFDIKGIKFSVLIEIGKTDPYIGIGRHFASDKTEPLVFEFVKNLLGEFIIDRDKKWWYGWKYVDYNEVYSEFKILVNKIIAKIDKEAK